MAKSKSLKSKMPRATKSKAVKHTPSAVEKDLAASLATLRKVSVPETLLVYKERAMNSVIKLNDRIKAEANKAVKTAEREAKKAERDKAKADRKAKAVAAKKVRAKNLRERIAKLQAQADELD